MPKTLKIVGFANKSTRPQLKKRYYKDQPTDETYITSEEILEHFQNYYDTEQLCRVIDAGEEEMWRLVAYEETDELEYDKRGWIGELIWSIDGLDGVFHTKFNTSSRFACWYSFLEWEQL